MLRNTQDRYDRASRVSRPTHPPQHAPEAVYRHHAVHLVAAWMTELTTAPIEEIHTRFAQCGRRGICTYEHTQSDAEALLTQLYQLQPYLRPEHYHSLYQHLMQGLA